MSEESERRTARRFHTIAPCLLRISGKEGHFEGSIQNIGQHGAFIKPDVVLPTEIVGCDADLLIFDPNIPTRTLIKSSGKIVHEGDDGIGFYMRSMDSQSFSQLKMLLEQEIKRSNDR